MELLVVIAILGLLAALTAPSLINFRKGDAIAAGTQQMLDVVARARQLAISQRTTVYLVFAPAEFWKDPAYQNNPRLRQQDWIATTNIAARQLVGYNFLALRRPGDQPGQGVPRYLDVWHSLPESTFVPQDKFTTFNTPDGRGYLYTVRTNPPAAGGFNVFSFRRTRQLPFPLADTPRSPSLTAPYASLPYIAFNYLGQLTTITNNSEVLGEPEFIPLAHGSVNFAKNKDTGRPVLASPSVSVQESPAGGSTNAYNLVFIDALTGRGHLEKREIQ